MDEDMDRIRELKGQGYFCSQILLIMGMDLMGKDNPDLVRAMNGLVGGLGFSGELCGALSGASCLLGLYAGKGMPDEPANPRLDFMIQDLVKWFKAEFGEKYGSLRCEAILKAREGSKTSPCPLLVSASFQKVKDLLVENGFDLAGSLE